MIRGRPAVLTKPQFEALSTRARELTSERYERLCSLSNAELLELKQTVEQIEIDGVPVELVTHIPHKEHPAFGVYVELWTARWRRWPALGATRWDLGHKAFWFIDGERKPFEDEDYW